MRGSDPDASLYWLVRMLESGEEPLYVARRIIRFASEDVGTCQFEAVAVHLRFRSRGNGTLTSMP